MTIEIMPTQENRIFNTVVNQLRIPANELLLLCLRSFLERQLNLVKTEIFKIYGYYNISSVEELTHASVCYVFADDSCPY